MELLGYIGWLLLLGCLYGGQSSAMELLGYIGWLLLLGCLCGGQIVAMWLLRCFHAVTSFG